MEPTKKSAKIEQALDKILGRPGARRDAVHGGRCVPAPIGCGGLALSFRDSLSAREYKISGLCQECQDKIFGETYDDIVNKE